MLSNGPSSSLYGYGQYAFGLVQRSRRPGELDSPQINLQGWSFLANWPGLPKATSYGGSGRVSPLSENSWKRANCLTFKCLV